MQTWCKRLVAIAAMVPTISAAKPPAGPTMSVALPHGAVRADLGVEISLTRNEAWDPVSIAPDMYLGLPAGITVGLIHSARGIGELTSGRGLCFGECPGRVVGTGIDVVWSAWRGGSGGVDLRGRALMGQWSDPAKPRIAPGVFAFGRIGWMSVAVDPHISFGLANRDRGNENRLNIPVWLSAHLPGRVEVFARSGLRGGLPNFRDKYAVPIGFGVGVQFASRWRAEAQLVAPRLGGPLNTFWNRDLLLRLSYQAND